MPGRSTLTVWAHGRARTHTHTFNLLTAVSVTVSSAPPPQHTLVAVAGLKRRGRTGDVETDGCWHQLKTRSLTLMGPKRDGEGRPHLGLIPRNQPAAKHKFRKRQWNVLSPKHSQAAETAPHLRSDLQTSLGLKFDFTSVWMCDFKKLEVVGWLFPPLMLVDTHFVLTAVLKDCTCV